MELEKKIELLRACRNVRRALLRNYTEQGNKFKTYVMQEIIDAYSDCIYILTNDEYAEEVKEIYKELPEEFFKQNHY